MAITESWLKANNRKARSKTLVKTDRDGLGVRVSPKGKITYCLRYYFNNKQTTSDIGTYPLMSLKEAREENRRLRKKLERGHNPKVVRQLEKQAISRSCFACIVSCRAKLSLKSSNNAGFEYCKYPKTLFIKPFGLFFRLFTALFAVKNKISKLY